MPTELRAQDSYERAVSDPFSGSMQLVIEASMRKKMDAMKGSEHDLVD